MKIILVCVGKTDDAYINEGIKKYEQRLKHYVSLQIVIIPELKNGGALNPEQLRLKEGELILDKLQASDIVVLLDEKGKEYTSVEFSGFIQKQMNAGIKNVVFIVGG